MDLSIVIVSYNTKELLEDCLKSIQKSNDKLKKEVFVIDNNSQDGSQESVAKNFPAVNLIANKDNLGFSKANNLALKKAKGKYILVLNPDTQLQKDTLGKMFSYMENHPEVGISTCRVELVNGGLDKDCRRHFPTPWRALCHFSKISNVFKGSKLFDQYYMGYLSDKQDHDIDSCVGAFMFVRSNALKVVGHFDEDFFFYGEDLDLCWRFWQKGYKVTFTPITKIIHHKGAASGMKPTSKHLTKATKDSKKRALRESTKAMVLFYKKHYKNKYPFFITWPVLTGIKLIENYRVLKV